MKTEELLLTPDLLTGETGQTYCFVCTGNTCRSPMAAAVLNRYGEGHGVRAVSRGLAASVGAPISENAAKALANAGILPVGANDYTRHRAVQLTAEDFERFDAVFALTSAHAQAMLFAFPAYAGKIRVLGEISDPYGGDEKRYADCLAEITAALKNVFPTLFVEEANGDTPDAN